MGPDQQTHRRHRHIQQRGFTLIELLVVIAVLAILAAIVLFNVVGVKNKGSAAACSTDVETIQTAVAAYQNDHATTGQLVAGDMTTAQGAEPASALTLLMQGGYIHGNTVSCSTMTLVGPASDGSFSVVGS